jgi:Gram-negative bacterial TonB protein C-terminal
MNKVIKYVVALLVVLLVLAPDSAITAQQENTVKDEDIKIVSFEDMRYPPLALLERVQGVVVVRVKLDDKGNTIEAEAISGPKLLIPDCLVNSKKWRFRPNSGKTAVIVYNFRETYGLCNAKTTQFSFLPPNFATITTCERPIQ